MLVRQPAPRLRPFVAVLWATSGRLAAGAHELVLPTGRAHLAIRTKADSLRIFADLSDVVGHEVGDAVFCGPRSKSYVKRVANAGGSVGAWLMPGAVHLLAGSDASRFAECHLPLHRLLGPSTQGLVARIRRTVDPEEHLDLLERHLLDLFPRVRGMEPGIASALEELAEGGTVGDAVRLSGYSERTLRNRFHGEIGLSPKRFGRVVRFQMALGMIAQGRALSATAAQCGYADQAHLTREFRSLAGLAPGRYQRLAPRNPNHVPIPDCRFVQDTAGRLGG